MTFRLWLSVAGVGAMAIGTACSAPPPNKTPLTVCTAGEDGCPDEKEQTSKPRRSSEPENVIGEAPELAPVASSRDAGADAEPAPSLGPSCRELKVCCGKLDTAGWLSTFCYEALEVGQEDICATKLKSYKEDPEGTPCF